MHTEIVRSKKVKAEEILQGRGFEKIAPNVWEKIQWEGPLTYPAEEFYKGLVDVTPQVTVLGYAVYIRNGIEIKERKVKIRFSNPKWGWRIYSACSWQD